jgi:hypothetical protein
MEAGIVEWAKLEGKRVVICDDLYEAATWLQAANRQVARDNVGDVLISTVFLGLNHAFPGGRPLWFETMIFGGPHSEFQERYETWEEAEAGHAKAVQLAREGLT